MTLPQIPTLTAKGKQYAVILAGAVALLVITYAVAYRRGANSQKTADDQATEHALHAQTIAAAKAGMAQQHSFDSLLAVAATQKPPLAKATQHTDSAEIVAQQARQTAEQAARDSQATADTLRARILTLAHADSLAYVAVVAERDAANLRISAQDAALRQAVVTIAQDSTALQLAAQDHAAQAKVITDLQKQVPSAFGKIVRTSLEVVGFVGALILGHSLR